MLRKLKLQVRGMEEDDAYVDYLHQRLDSLQKLIGSRDGVRWNIRLTKDGHAKHGQIFHAEAQFKTAKKNFGADARAETPYEAIDKLRDELQGKITNHKDKRITRLRKGGALLKKMLRQTD